MEFSEEFKKALKDLSEKEKDKLLLRLLKKDVKLANKLFFELVDTDTPQDKREKLKVKIIDRIERTTNNYYSPGYLLMDLRDLSGLINEHVAVTKDKIGEIVLNCLMLRNLLELSNEKFAFESLGRAYTLCIYIVNRMFKIMMLIQKQHEDYHLEFRDDIESIGCLIGQNPNLMKIAVTTQVTA